MPFESGMGAVQFERDPAPAASPPVTSFSNMSFGSAAPLAPYVLNSIGINGCNGSDGGFDELGNPGLPGQPGGQIIGTNTGLTITGGSQPDPSVPITFGAGIYALGGLGGGGGDSGYVGNGSVIGGNAAGGGNGGTITVHFNGTFLPAAGSGLTTYGLYAAAAGGNGGRGGASDNNGIYAKGGGLGGPGGNGGDGGEAPTIDQLDNTYGGKAGNGGNGGSAAIQLLGTVTAGQVGAQAFADGGAGGKGGTMRATWIAVPWPRWPDWAPMCRARPRPTCWTRGRSWAGGIRSGLWC